MVLSLLDLRKKICPYPTSETRRCLKSMQEGDTLVVLTDFYPAKQTIPDLCQQMGYPVELAADGPGLWRIIIKKTGQGK